jgi:glycine cleavage system H protein
MKTGHCPYLEVTRVTYCKAIPMRKMIPVDKNAPQKGMCHGAGFRKCMTYRDSSERIEVVDRVRGFVRRPDYCLHPRHVWVSVHELDRTRVRVGIDDLAQKLIGRIDRISLPAEGAAVKENGICMILRSGERTVRMVAPIDGLVVSVNPGLATDPSIVNRSPYDEGWILALTPTGEGIRRLLRGGAAKSWFEWEVEKLQRMLSPEVGATAADGGESLADIGSGLDETQWAGLAAAFFG